MKMLHHNGGQPGPAMSKAIAHPAGIFAEGEVEL
jgi:hypothetical protein